MPHLCLLACIVVFIIIDYTFIAFFRFVCSGLKDNSDNSATLDPHRSYENRLKHSNIMGSYKMIRNPDYKHAVTAMNDLMRKAAQKRQTNESMQTLNE
jgi:hypothetical protein